MPTEIDGKRVLREVDPEVDSGAARRTIPQSGGGIDGHPPSLGALPSSDVAVGDRVEVECNGKWFAGVLCSIDGGLAGVQCDVQLPGVHTTAPLSKLRRIAPDRNCAEDHPTRLRSSNHKRAKSAT